VIPLKCFAVFIWISTKRNIRANIKKNIYARVGLRRDPGSELDALTIGNHLVVKIEQDEALKESYENVMNWTKREWMLVGVVTLFLTGIINFVSHYVIISYLEVSIYNALYEMERQKYVGTKDSAKAHPFYGLSSAVERGFDSSVSIEDNFLRVSPKPHNDEIKVLILGGSVAAHLSMKREDIPEDYLLSKALNKKFNTDRFVVYNAAFLGGKQPQQYFKLLYLELLGFVPDVIVNYDGFNEVALPFGENYDRDLNAIYPVNFNQTIISTASKRRCIPLNNWLLSSNSYIPVIELVKWIYVRYCHNEVSGSKRNINFVRNELFEIEKNNYSQKVQNIWMDSSNKIAQFSETRKIPYIHILQPNQYVVGSKPLSNLETEEFYGYEPYKKPIAAHYHNLSISNLATPYKLDQRQLFKSEKRTVYSDECCHLNRLGMEMIVDDLISSFTPLFSGLKDGAAL